MQELPLSQHILPAQQTGIQIYLNIQTHSLRTIQAESRIQDMLMTHTKQNSFQ